MIVWFLICNNLLDRTNRGGLEIMLSHMFFAQIKSRNWVKFMFTPSLPNHAECQIDNSQIMQFFIQCLFSRSTKCRITPSRFPLWGPLNARFIKWPFLFCWSFCLSIFITSLWNFYNISDWYISFSLALFSFLGGLEIDFSGQFVIFAIMKGMWVAPAGIKWIAVGNAIFKIGFAIGSPIPILGKWSC